MTKYRVFKNVNKDSNANCKWEAIEDFEDLNEAKRLARTYVDGKVYTESGNGLDEAYFGNMCAEDEWDSMIEIFDY